MAGLHLVEPQQASRAQKLIVEFVRGAWRVSGERQEAAFDARQAAVEFACERARAACADGLVGLVVVRAEPSELHCFTPGARP